LEVEPETLGKTEISRKPQGGVGGYRAFPVNDLVDSARRYIYILCEPVLTNLERNQKFLDKDFAGMDWFDRPIIIAFASIEKGFIMNN